MHSTIGKLVRYLLVSLGSIAVPALAQLPPLDLNLDTGIKPYETYDRAQENVNIGSGNLEVEIPLYHLPGRNGLDFTYKLVYNSQNWTPVGYENSTSSGSLNPDSVLITWTVPNAGQWAGWQGLNPLYQGSNVPVLYFSGVSNPPGCLPTGCYCQIPYSYSSMYTNFYLVMGDGRKYVFPYASFLHWTTNAYQAAGSCADPAYSTQFNPSSDVLIDYDDNAGFYGSSPGTAGSHGDSVELDLTNATSGNGTAIVRFKDGTQLLFGIAIAGVPQPSSSSAPSAPNQTIAAPAGAMMDANGNWIPLGTGGGSTGVNVPPISAYSNQSAAQSACQLTAAEIAAAAGAYQIGYYDSNGQIQVITECVTPQFPLNPAPSFQTPAAGPTSTSGLSDIASVSTDPIANEISALILPDGLTYTFQYNQYGELTEITYPTGGYTRYTYAAIPNMNMYMWTSDVSGFADRRVVVEKDTCPAAAVPAGAVTPSGYAGPSTPPSTCPVAEQKTTYVNNGRIAVTDPLGNETDYTFAGTVCSQGPFPTSVSPEPSTAGAFNYSYEIPATETSRTIYQGSAASGKLLRTVNSTYSSLCPPLKQSETTVLPNGQLSQTAWTYDTTPHPGSAPAVNDQGTEVTPPAVALTNNVLSQSEYSFGSGSSLPLLRTTNYSYLSQGFTASPVNGVNYEGAFVYILNRQTQETVLNGSGAMVAQTNYTYDSYSGGISPSGAVQHGTSLNSYSSGYTTRGNVTQAQKWVAGSTWAASQYQYDDAGNVLAVTDPLGHQTHYSFADVWSNSECIPSSGVSAAFPTAITNAAGQTMNYFWNSCTGTMASATDANSQTTTFAYDEMDRRISASYPDGGETSLNYEDSALPIQIVETKAITSSLDETSTIVLDGLSRVSQTELNSDPDGATTVLTTYDAAGNVASVTNPFRSTSDPTYGVTSYQYDALHRKVIQVEQDGSTLQWCYDGIAVNALQSSSLCTGNLGSQAGLGEWVDSLDENGNHWQRTTDALGRLIEVMEPNGTVQAIGTSLAPALETDYSYDALDDLVKVNQLGNSGSDTARTRSFTYDGLARLLSAANPESGTVNYAYDLDGNVLAKTDARGITINYAYDALNRLYQKTYTAGSSSTNDPTVCMQYDTPGSAATFSPHAVGRLTMAWTQAAGTTCPGPGSAQTAPPANAISSQVIRGYDAMGRLEGDQQCPLGGNCAAPYPFIYTYDLAGDLALATNGIPSSSSPYLAWTSYADGAQRLDHITMAVQPAAWNTMVTNVKWPKYLSLPELLEATPSTGYDPLGNLINANLGVSSSGSSAAASIARQYDKRNRILSEADEGNTALTAGVDSAGSITVTGSEASATAPATSGSGVINVIGADGTMQQCTTTEEWINAGDSGEVEEPVTTCSNVPATGTISVTVDGFTSTAAYGSSSTTATLASALASGFSASGSPVKAVASGSSLTLTAVATGTASNYSITTSGGGGFAFSPSSGTLAGGANPTTVYNAGTMTATITNNSGTPATSYTTAQVSWGQGSTPSSVASSLASAINSTGAPVTATASGAVVTLTSNAAGVSSDYAVTASVTDTEKNVYPSLFSSPSFQLSAVSMAGGINPSSASTVTVYSYAVPAGGYAPNGNLLSYTDNGVMGAWSFSYDNLNRVANAAGNEPNNADSNYCWNYDSFGNRTLQLSAPGAFSSTMGGAVTCSYTGSGSSGPSMSASYNGAVSGTNRMNQTTQNVNQASNYDAAGDVLNDGLNQYAYDGEGRLCAVYNPVLTSLTGYAYDAQGRRVAKGSLAVSTPSASNPMTAAQYCNLAGSSSFTANAEYLLDADGNQVTELNTTSGAMAWAHTNIFAAGTLDATYDASGLHFHLKDPLGSRRVQVAAAGCVENEFQSLPFGDGLTPYPVTSGACAATADDSTEHHFTAKERDQESGNDYFGARYYASSMGRWLSPDWSAKVMPVPYAKLDNPQSLNLYAYVLNNPLDKTDPDGHDFWDKVLNTLQGKGWVDTPRPQLAPSPSPPPATIAASTPTGVVAVYHQATGKIETLDAAGNKKDLGAGHAGEGTGRNNPDAQNRKDTDQPRGNAGPLPRGEYTIGPQQDNQTSNGKTLYASMRLTDNPSNNMDGRDSNSFLIHGGELSTGCVVADRATRDAIAISGTNTLEVER